MLEHHGCARVRGLNAAPLPGEQTRFGRLFPELPPNTVPSQLLEQIGAAGGPMDEGAFGGGGEAALPVGFVFFGQFIDHDITLDVSSSLDAARDPDASINVRTASLDLDCVYGAGREATPFYYDGARMLLGDPGNGLDPGSDLPRNVRPDGERGTALIGDPRNDENRIVSQLHLAILKFHNAVVTKLETDAPGQSQAERFETARRMVRWHYQWVVLHDFLPRVCGTARMECILGGRWRTPFFSKPPVIPVEFSGAAYRFGHTQVPAELATNNPAMKFALFSPEIGQGFTPVNDADDLVDWELFFGGGPSVQNARKLDVKLASTLLNLPGNVVGPEAGTPRASLAVRNLLRGQTFGLPSGQAVAGAMGVKALDEAQLWPAPDVPTALREAMRQRAPLWYYILREAQIERDGEKLGKVGGHLVGEVITGLIRRDPTSFLGANPNWRPDLPRAEAAKPAGDFDMVDLLTFAGVF